MFNINTATVRQVGKFYFFVLKDKIDRLCTFIQFEIDSTREEEEDGSCVQYVARIKYQRTFFFLVLFCASELNRLVSIIF